MMLVLWFFLINSILSLALLLVGNLLYRRHCRLAKKSQAHHHKPPVSILKPLKGLDDEVENNLEGFFHLDYPEYEILFTVSDPNDPATELAVKLKDKYSNVPCQLFVGGSDIGVNPKINNMYAAYEAAAHDVLLVSDSNARVQPHYLHDMVSYLKNDVGVVSGAVHGNNAKNIGAWMEVFILSSIYTRWMGAFSQLGFTCVIGKSMLFRKSVAERFGGLKVLANYLAEDFMFGEAVRKLGLKVIMTAEPIRQHLGSVTFSSFWLRHLRWGRMRKKHALALFAFEPLSTSLFAAVTGSIAASKLLGFPPSLYCAMHLFVWYVLDAHMLKWQGTALSLRTPIYWLVREITSIPMWLHIATGNSINWRGDRFELKPGGYIRPAPSPSQSQQTSN